MDCTECGACCLNQTIPVVREDNIPPEYVDEEGNLKKKGGHCVFFDLKTRRCTHYENRPAVCRDFQKESWECLGIKFWAHTLGWFSHLEKPLTPEQKEQLELAEFYEKYKNTLSSNPELDSGNLVPD